MRSFELAVLERNVMKMPEYSKLLNPIKSAVKKYFKKTPEFFVPEYGLEVEEYIRRGSRKGIHHLARYHWAKRVIDSYSCKKILDIACGAGYGSYILADSLPKSIVVGGDYDDKGIKIAKNSWVRNNLLYTEANMVTWESFSGSSTQDLGQYDAIVSFDTIEHLLHREIALIRITQNLEDDGIFLISTPCAHNVTRLNPGWDHHKIEYSHTDLRNLLMRFFGKILIPENSEFPFMKYWDDVINKDERRYVNKSNPIVCLNPIKF